MAGRGGGGGQGAGPRPPPFPFGTGRDKGASFRELLSTMRAFAAALERESTHPLPAVHDALVRGMETLEAAISWLQEAGGRDKRLPLAAAVPFLELTGTVLGGYEHAR